MKRLIYSLALLLLVLQPFSADSRPRKHIIGFYNLENLFDTTHDEGKDDSEFLPDGANKWTEDKYRTKLSNMARVIAAMKEENGMWHTVLGVAEVENRHVLEDLVAEPQIAAVGYQIVHHEGPDTRGIDVALLYDPGRFTLIESESLPYTFDSPSVKFSLSPEEQAEFRTRDALMVHGLIDGEHFAIYVAHLPSRRGEKSGDLRSRGAEIIYMHSLEMMRRCPGIKCVVMGDMNDDPVDESMTQYLHGRETIAEMAPEDYFSPFLSMLKNGYGTLSYRGVWNIFDCILVSYSLANAPKGTLRIVPTPSTKKKFYGSVFKQPFMTQQSGRYAGTPFRTFSGGEFIGGYSDHYPTYIVIKK